MSQQARYVGQTNTLSYKKHWSEELVCHPHRWGMLPRIKYIAGYQTNPVSAITRYARVDRIEP